MAVKPQNCRMRFRRVLEAFGPAFSRRCIRWRCYLFSLAGRSREQVGGTAAVSGDEINSLEIRQSAASTTFAKAIFEQVLKILEVPAEWALPISLVEDDPLASALCGSEL